MTDGGVNLESAAKALAYLLAQLAIGLPLIRRLTAPGRGAAAGDVLDRHLSRAALVVALLLMVALAVRAWAHTAAAFGPADAWSVENLRLIAVQSRWGRRWQLQVVSALFLVGAGVLAPRHRTARWVLYASSAVAFTLVMPALGHAAGTPLWHAVHAAHLLASSAWIGGLGVLTVLVLASHHGTAAGGRIVAAFSRFSAVALPSVAVVFVSGALAAVRYLARVDALWTTDYGRLLAIKLALVGAVLVCGWRNWQVVSSGRVPARAWLLAEYALALAVVAATGILTETEHP